MENNKFVVIDTETTGLDSQIHEMIEIACVFFTYDPETKEYTLEESVDYKIIPEHIETGDPASLKVNKYSPELWVDALPLKQVLEKISKKLQNRVIIGHNVGFDYYFLDRAFKNTQVENLLHYHALDTISIAYAKLKDVPEVKRLSLMYMCNYFGITNDNAHSALGDAMATFELFKKLMSI